MKKKIPPLLEDLKSIRAELKNKKHEYATHNLYVN